MLSVKRDQALKVGAPPPGQPFPKESKKLGVDVCLLPNTDKMEWQEESRFPCDSEDLGGEDAAEEKGVGAAAAAMVGGAPPQAGTALNGGGDGDVAGDGGEAGLQREGSDWDALPGASIAQEEEGEEGTGLKQGGGTDRVVVAVAPGEGGDAAAAGASSEQP